MEVKALDSLSPEDFSEDSIWVDCETVSEFIDEPELGGYLHDENLVAKIDVRDHPLRLSVLVDIGRFYIGCKLEFANRRVLDGVAYMRASDLCPYYAEAFSDSGNKMVPLFRDEGCDDDIKELADLLGGPPDQLYPVKVRYRQVGLILEEEAVFKL